MARVTTTAYTLLQCQLFMLCDGSEVLKNVVFTCVSYVEARNRYRLDVRPSVCPSVCPSVTRWYCIKTAEHIVMLSSPHDSAFILVFVYIKIFAKFRRGHPLLGR